MNRFALSAIMLAVAASTLNADIVNDAPNDFLPTYTGPQGLDLDVRTTQAFLNTTNNTISVTATLGGAIGTTTGAFYVFGFNRGAGTQRFVTGNPSIGAGVSFDSVLILRPDGTSQFNDLISGINTILPLGSVSISGNTISSAALPLSLFTPRGFNPVNYTFNLWPRVSTVSGNAAISDFAPDASNAGVTVIPAPAASIALVSAGLMASRRRRSIAR